MVLDRGCEHAVDQVVPAEIELVGAVDGIADLGPVHQVAAVEHGYPREPAEGGVHQVVVGADADHARIGIEALQHRIAELARARRVTGVGRVAAFVLEPVERGLQRRVVPVAGGSVRRRGRGRRGSQQQRGDAGMQGVTDPAHAYSLHDARTMRGAAERSTRMPRHISAHAAE